MENQFERTELLVGKDGVNKLKQAKVAIFGIGGVGSFTSEALARAGIGHLVLLDNDYIDVTNINRQIHATHKTIGKSKVEVMKQRILDINPNADVQIYQTDKMKNDETDIIDTTFSYVIDAVDTTSEKIKIVEKANMVGVSVISGMGAGNKMDPTKFEVEDIYKTSVCPLCRVMRKELKNRNIKNLKVVYSKEEPIKQKLDENNLKVRPTIGSISFVPSVSGLIIAGEVIKDILKKK